MGSSSIQENIYSIDLVKPTRIYLTGTEAVHLWNGVLFSDLMLRLIRQSSLDIVVIDTPAEADIILFLEPCCLKDRLYVNKLSNNSIFIEYAHKCYVYSIDDFSIAFLPGVYVNLERRHHTENFTSPCGYLFHANDHVESIYEKNRNTLPKYKACFRGSINVPVRQNLIEAGFHKGNPDYQITAIDNSKWFKHSDREKTDYLIEIINSKYVICPRGLGTTSYRLYETLQLGRVPIILSDEWVAPYDLDWDTFSLRISENQIDTIPEFIEANEANWSDMAKMARHAWETSLAPTNQINYIVTELIRLSKQPKPTASLFVREWKNDKFWRSYGLGIWDRLRKKIHR